MADKVKQIEHLKLLLVLKIICMIGLFYSFILGPLAVAVRIYFYIQQPSVQGEAPPIAVNLLSVIGFIILIWFKQTLDKRIKETESRLAE